MTLPAFFSKEERLLKQEKKKLEIDRLSLLEDNYDIKEFVTWFLRRRYYKEGKRQKDKDIDFIWLGYEAQEHFNRLVGKHPYIAVLTNDRDAYVAARRRSYAWLDNEGNWNKWDRFMMEDHYQVFLKCESENPVYGDYILEELDPMGSSEIYPACAYLSYAYHEEIRWRIVIQKLLEFVRDADDAS